jgi:hypothetical protein
MKHILSVDFGKKRILRQVLEQVLEADDRDEGR